MTVISATLEAEAGGPQFWDQLGLYSEFKASLASIVIPCVKKEIDKDKIYVQRLVNSIISYNYRITILIL
jgi:hypothetical protein